MLRNVSRLLFLSACIIGTSCQMNDSCSSEPCLRGGVCFPVESENDFICVCPMGSTGKTCSIGNGDTANNLTTTNIAGMPSITLSGSTGTTAPTGRIANGDTTEVSSSGTTSATRQTGTSQKPRVSCADNPCLANGRCIPLGTDFICLCPVGFVGKTCEQATGSSTTATPGSTISMVSGTAVETNGTTVTASSTTQTESLGTADRTTAMAGGTAVMSNGTMVTVNVTTEAVNGTTVAAGSTTQAPGSTTAIVRGPTVEENRTMVTASSATQTESGTSDVAAQTMSGTPAVVAGSTTQGPVSTTPIVSGTAVQTNGTMVTVISTAGTVGRTSEVATQTVSGTGVMTSGSTETTNDTATITSGVTGASNGTTSTIRDTTETANRTETMAGSTMATRSGATELLNDTAATNGTSITASGTTSSAIGSPGATIVTETANSTTSGITVMTSGTLTMASGTSIIRNSTTAIPGDTAAVTSGPSVLTSGVTTTRGTTSAATSGVSTSTTAPDGLQCFQCNGVSECTADNVPLGSCPEGQMCFSANITIGLDPATSLPLIRRGCENIPTGQRGCITSSDILAMRPDFLPVQVSINETSGRACLCDSDACNININQEDTDIVIVLLETTGLSDEITVTWYLIGVGSNVDGFFVEVQVSGSDDWFTISPFLATDMRSFSITGVQTVNVSAIRVVAVDQSKHVTSKSLPFTIRKVESGTKIQQETNRRFYIFGFAIAVGSAMVVISAMAALWYRKRRNRNVQNRHSAGGMILQT